METPNPTKIYRLIHLENLSAYLERNGIHAPNTTPNDGLLYKTIHNEEIQQTRHERRIPCGPQGVVHDYVPFYLGPLSPMLLQLHTGKVEGYEEGQKPLIYLVSTAQKIVEENLKYVFSDGHGIAIFTKWFDDLADLGKLDWPTIYAKYWADTLEDMDRQRRKQAEFLIHQFCPWSAIIGIGVINSEMVEEVEIVLKQYNADVPVKVTRSWYY
ncbi:MAG: DUF4433 domain-containing protein [SAR324 cluster bacterium]|nr:DUF4433 domain-containing protein [SAR324 cluster bacterium]